MKQFKNQNGITLVALVITIIILLILAGISISSLTNNGLFEKAQEADRKTEIAGIKEKIQLDIYAKQLQNLGTITDKELESILKEYGTVNYEEDVIKGITTEKGYEIPISEIYTGEIIIVDPRLPENPATTVEEAQSDYMLDKKVNSPIEDAYRNKITIPAGFKITADATTADKGIVIQDKDKNQFVWIPVPKEGWVYKDTNGTKANDIQIKLDRYAFATDGTPSAYSGLFIEEDSTDTDDLLNYGNTIAKDIEAFKTSVAKNEGYYIGRYEARTETARSSKTDTITTITENGNHYIYNYVTQIQAADLARNMYDNTKPFTSDLMNSYAWDTAISFLQECGTNSGYSRLSNINYSFVTTGTNNQETKDVQCNVYDMAGNTTEWTTETSNNSGHSCVPRGDDYGISSNYAGNRGDYFTSSSYDFISFRPILYLND